MSSIRNVTAGELGDNMQWEMRWLPSYFYKDDDEDEAEWEMRWLPPYFYKDDKEEEAFEEEGVIITIGSEPIVTPSSYMTFEQICLAARLTSAIKRYHLEKANKEKEKEEKEQKEASFQLIVKKKKRRVRKCGVSSKKMRR
jgi:hypothetical protein